MHYLHTSEVLVVGNWLLPVSIMSFICLFEFKDSLNNAPALCRPVAPQLCHKPVSPNEALKSKDKFNRLTNIF